MPTNMRPQQEIWHNEHTKGGGFPSYQNPEPSNMVVEFKKWLDEHGYAAGAVIDIGCGKGRNSIYLAQQNFTVTAVDYIEPALDWAREQATKSNVANKIEFKQMPIDEPWPFADHTFDYAVDCFSSIDIETRAGREVYCAEMWRTLKPGGVALVAVVSVDDEYEREVLAAHPDAEPNSTLWPGTGKFQKDYDEAELREFYARFNILEIKVIRKQAEKMGRKFTATNLFVTLQKP